MVSSEVSVLSGSICVYPLQLSLRLGTDPDSWRTYFTPIARFHGQYPRTFAFNHCLGIWANLMSQNNTTYPQILVHGGP
jgi:hypothetical protein